jgi:Xaa-Pro aminopeptidase
MELTPQSVTPALCDGEIILPGSLTRGAVCKAFPSVHLEDITGCLMEMRRRKEIGEIERINRANAVALEALQYFKQVMQHANGLREIDVASMIESYVSRNVSSFGARYGRAWAQITSGTRTAEAWNAGLVTTDRRILAGELVMIEMGTIVDGYFCDLSTTHYMEHADEQQLSMLYMVEKAQERALGMVKAGARAADVDAAAREYLSAQGMGEYFVHGTGHGVGFAYHDGGPALVPSSEDVLETGMIHSVEPGIYIPGVGGVRFEVNVLVTDSGYRILGVN